MKNILDLIEIDPEKIKSSPRNVFFGLALIRNDLSDLIYLQSLHSKERNSLNIKKYEVSADRGRNAGHDIYIIRLILSQLYSIIEFFYKRENDIDRDLELKRIIKKISPNDQKTWELILEIAKNFNSRDGSGPISANLNKIWHLSSITRNDLTYHYHGILKHISIGYTKAFNSRKLNTDFAYVTEMIDVKKDRSYYVDISLQKYLEDKVGLDKELVPYFEDDVLNLIADINRVISIILKEYHLNLIK